MSQYQTLCVVLQRSIDLRIDVQKCSIDSDLADPHLLDIRIVKEGGKKIYRQVNAEKILQWQQPTGELIDSWIGPEPVISGRRDANWVLARAQAHANPPAMAVDLMVDRKPTAPAQLPENGENTQAPGSQLDWSSGQDIPAPRMVISDPKPVGPHYTDPDTNETRPMMTRERMIELGMTQQQRHRQYEKQGGPHPSDPK